MRPPESPVFEFPPSLSLSGLLQFSMLEAAVIFGSAFEVQNERQLNDRILPAVIFRAPEIALTDVLQSKENLLSGISSLDPSVAFPFNPKGRRYTARCRGYEFTINEHFLAEKREAIAPIIHASLVKQFIVSACVLYAGFLEAAFSHPWFSGEALSYPEVSYDHPFVHRSAELIGEWLKDMTLYWTDLAALNVALCSILSLNCVAHANGISVGTALKDIPWREHLLAFSMIHPLKKGAVYESPHYPNAWPAIPSSACVWDEGAHYAQADPSDLLQVTQWAGRLILLSMNAIHLALEKRLIAFSASGSSQSRYSQGGTLERQCCELRLVHGKSDPQL